MGQFYSGDPGQFCIGANNGRNPGTATEFWMAFRDLVPNIRRTRLSVPGMGRRRFIEIPRHGDCKAHLKKLVQV